MSLLQNLDRIRELQGRPPMPDPTKIAGFGPGDAPPAPYIPPPHDPDVPAEWLDPELGEGPQPLPPSPLIPKSRLVEPPPDPSPPEVTKILALVELLTWKGQPAPFSDQDRQAIRAITMRAFQRELESVLDAMRPRRKPKQPRTTPQEAQTTQENGGAVSGPPSAPMNEPPKRRRGRPRGSLLRP